MGSATGMSLPRFADDKKNAIALEDAMAVIATAMADSSRVRMLCALMDGRAWTATELSAVADIAASTASGHLSKLVKGGLIICVSQGRHRYYRLAGHDIAGLLETMMGVSMRDIRAPQTRAPRQLRHARTCYDHLAGELAVNIYDFMLREQWLEADGSAVTEVGKHHLHSIGVVLDPRPRRKPCCACLDWSERRFHLGGDAGAALLTAFEQKGWLSRVPGYREVIVTDEGKSALRRVFAINSGA